MLICLWRITEFFSLTHRSVLTCVSSSVDTIPTKMNTFFFGVGKALCQPMRALGTPSLTRIFNYLRAFMLLFFDMTTYRRYLAISACLLQFIFLHAIRPCSQVYSFNFLARRKMQKHYGSSMTTIKFNAILQCTTFITFSRSLLFVFNLAK